MSRIMMAVEVHNESSAPLVWDRDELAHGNWTSPWYPSKHPSIPPGGSAEWRAEGKKVLVAKATGTEGRVWYNVGGDKRRQLYIHFNSPLIESSYGNTFHVWAPPGFAVAHDGGQGGHARLSIRFRDSVRRSVRGFRPSTNGFAFPNNWNPGLPAMTVGYVWNRLYDKIGPPVAQQLGIGRVDDDWLPFTRADAGLCGGMVFAAMDYFAARRLPPALNTAPDQESDPLFRHIRARLRDSFDLTGSGHRWLGYSSPHYPNGDEGFIQVVGLARGRSWVTYREEWPRIRADIDNNRLSPVGLIQTDSLDIGKNHQVLAYAYRQDGQQVTLWIYDPNFPRADQATLTFDITDTAKGVGVRRDGVRSDKPFPRIFCMFRIDGYRPVAPPGGRPLTVRHTLDRAIGRRHGRLPADAKLSRPASLRRWRETV